MTLATPGKVDRVCAIILLGLLLMAGSGFGAEPTRSGTYYDGPAGRIGFAPRAVDFRELFTTPTAWGAFAQRVGGGWQVAGLIVKWGTLRLDQVELDATEADPGRGVAIAVGGLAVPSMVMVTGRHVVAHLDRTQVLTPGEMLVVMIGRP